MLMWVPPNGLSQQKCRGGRGGWGTLGVHVRSHWGHPSISQPKGRREVKKPKIRSESEASDRFLPPPPPAPLPPPPPPLHQGV